MNILCTVDISTREVALPAGVKIAAYDHNVAVIRYYIEPIEDFSLDESSIKIAAQGPDGTRHDYAVDPSTVSVEEETGYITFDWPIPAGVTQMPLDRFKLGSSGTLTFAVCAEIIDGNNVSQAWHSDDATIKVVAHLEPEAGGGEDPEEEATNAQKIAQLQTSVTVLGAQVGALANGSPIPVETIAEMEDETAIYLYTGSETGESPGYWYYYNGSAWVAGGEYGGAVTDTTLSISGSAADAKAVGDALALKADADDLDALDDRVTSAESALAVVTDAERTYNWSQYTGTDGNYSTGLTLINGYIRSVTGSYPGRITSESSHYLYWFQAVADTYVAVDVAAKARLRVSSEQPETGNSKAFTGVVYGDSGDYDLPNVDSPVLVEAGKYIAFGTNNAGNTITLKYATTWTETAGLKQSLLLTEAMEAQVDSKINNTANGLEVIPMTWETGVFSTTIGDDIRGAVSGADSRKSSGLIYYPHPVYIENDREFKVRITKADSSYAITGTTDLLAGNFVSIPAGMPVRLTITNQGTTTITDNDETINAHVRVIVLYGHDNTDVRWCALGDSITQGWYSTIENNETHNYTDASKTWVGKVAKANGWLVDNLGIGSTGYLDPVSESDYSTAGFSIARTGDFKPYNLVTLAYGINDWKANRVPGSYEDAPVAEATPTTVMQAMRATIEAIMTDNPACKIIVILPLNCDGYSHSYGNKASNYALGYSFSTSGTLESFVQKMIEVCDYYGIQYIDQTHYSVINRENLTSLLPDGVHPSLATHELLAHELSKKITF